MCAISRRAARPVSSVSLLLVAALAFASIAWAQAPVIEGAASTVFGVTVVDAYGLRGEIYLLEPWTPVLPNFKKLKPVGAVYTQQLNIAPRNFTEGFPGITDRFEWFAIDYNGHFWIEKPGKYRFLVASDDGSKLFIDGKLLIDNDGMHEILEGIGSVPVRRNHRGSSASAPA